MHPISHDVHPHYIVILPCVATMCVEGPAELYTSLICHMMISVPVVSQVVHVGINHYRDSWSKPSHIRGSYITMMCVLT